MASTDEFWDPGCPLQLVKLDMENKRVDVNEEALGHLEKVFKKMGTHKVAIVSVMGAFRTGKSFLLDLFLRFLRYEESCTNTTTSEPPPRGGTEEFPLPAWLTAAGDEIEGSRDCPDSANKQVGGFRFKGGMDACTEGIWVWSKPFVRIVNGKPLAVLLMDTQGAWDGQMTKEQSATIFGLTAVLSSKQIYNISMQIQEDKVENLAYFMKFAQAALRRSGEASNKSFQELDFLVRDWSHFGDSWTVEECKAQMDKHLEKHLDPKKVAESSTAEALHEMFQNIRCYCLPHPGLAIRKEAWSGRISDIDNDFIRFADGYIKDVFQNNLDTKSILGSDMSTLTFPLIFRDFVKAFADAAPVAMTFTQAMTQATVLLAKEQAMVNYTTKMDEILSKNLRGMDKDELKQLHRKSTVEIKSDYEQITIFGSDDTRSEAWDSIEQNLQNIFKRYMEDNERRLEKALVAFANISLLGFCLFILDRASDWVCDWWSQTCADMSKLMMAAYVVIFIYLGFNVYRLFKERGKFAAGIAAGELWKEMMRLLGVYAELAASIKASEIPGLLRKLKDGKFKPIDKTKKDS